MSTTILPVAVQLNLSENYPHNTVLGRICLLERLDYDKDVKEKVDIYFKPRLLRFFFDLLSGLHTGYLAYRVGKFKMGFCLSQTTFSSLGGSR